VATALGKGATFVEDAERALSIAASTIHAGDVVLVKGSRSIGTEKIVRALENERGGRRA
jgi:UDP-N-acetylmuramyl pentapeptide synthase